MFKKKVPEAAKTPEEKRKETAIAMGKFYIGTKTRTYAEVATKFGVSSSTVGSYLKNILPNADPVLYKKVEAKIKAVALKRQEQFKKNVVTKKPTLKKKV